MFFYVKLTFFVLLSFLSIQLSNAYNITAIKNGERNYSLRGAISASDLQREVYPNAIEGLYYIYNAADLYNAVYFSNPYRRCSSNKEQAVRTINSYVTSDTLKDSALSSKHNNTITIGCQIEYTSPRAYWMFNENIGKPLDPSVAKCNVSVPSEVDFGTVTEGDNNKVIEKQVTIKCDKATKMRLTLQGDNNTDLLTLSGTKIKISVDGGRKSKDYSIDSNRIFTTNLFFTLSEAGDVPGVKKGYVLLVSEVI